MLQKQYSTHIKAMYTQYKYSNQKNVCITYTITLPQQKNKNAPGTNQVRTKEENVFSTKKP